MLPSPTRPGRRRAPRFRGRLLCAAALVAATPAAVAQDDAGSRYRIDARLDAAEASLDGRVRIAWRNPSRTRSLSEIALRLYPNAFRGADSVYLRALGDQDPDRLRTILEDERTGGIDLQAVRIDGKDIPPPDDPHATAVRLPLPAPLAPGAWIELDIAFRVDVPKVVSRFGRVEDLYVFTQWYPQVAGYRCCGLDEGFVTPEHHPHSEFFANFADYEVVLDLPESFVLGSSGLPVGEPRRDAGRAVHHLRAERVHQFAWAADPDFVEKRLAAAGVEIRALFHAAQADRIDRYLEPAARTLETFGEDFGAYPYPRLTLVAGHMLHHAMEYPNLVLLPAPLLELPRKLRVAEISAIHEVGHQWWYGLAANDETRDAWLDEGINSFWTARLTESLYGAGRDALDRIGLRGSVLGNARASYIASPGVDPPATPGRAFLNRFSYVSGSYFQPQLVFETLARRFGIDAVRRVFRRYMDAVRFEHPVPADLSAAFEAELGAEAAAFLEAWTGSLGRTDPAVHSVFDEPADPLEDDEEEDTARRQIVRLVQRGTVAVPVEVRMTFADGTSQESSWTGSRWAALSFSERSPIERVEVDPQQILVLDADPTNNVWRAQSSPAGPAQQRTWAALAALLLSAVGP